MFACASSRQDTVRRCPHDCAGILLPRLPLLFASRKCKTLPRSSFLRFVPKLSRCHSFSLGVFLRQRRQTQSPRCRGLCFFCATLQLLAGILDVRLRCREEREAARIQTHAVSFLSVCKKTSPHYLRACFCRISIRYLRGFLMFACAAASLAMGTRKGEQET